MPYFGKTKYAIVDKYGPYSVAVFHFTTNELLCVALDTPEGYIFVHSNTLYIAKGKVALCQAVESLPESQHFSLTEQATIEAIVEEAARVAVIREGGTDNE